MRGRISLALAGALLVMALFALVAQTGCAGSGGFADGSLGSRLYRTRCRSCHSLIDPASKKLEWWHINLDRYAQLAHLTAAERDSVMAFVERAAVEATRRE
jgi:hypothetical protein